jgi:hypothetical protein
VLAHVLQQCTEVHVLAGYYGNNYLLLLLLLLLFLQYLTWTAWLSQP